VPFYIQQSLHCYPKALSLEELISGVSNVAEKELLTTKVVEQNQTYEKKCGERHMTKKRRKHLRYISDVNLSEKTYTLFDRTVGNF
jgi:hypothetical protein